MQKSHPVLYKAPRVVPSAFSIGIVYTSWNAEIVKKLVDGCVGKLLENGVLEANITMKEVPGSFELPFVAKRLTHDCQAVIAIGVLIKGDTMHFEYIADAVCHGLMRVGLDTGVPVIFGVLTCLDVEQAAARAGMNGGVNHGEEWALAALQMMFI